MSAVDGAPFETLNRLSRGPSGPELDDRGELEEQQAEEIVDAIERARPGYTVDVPAHAEPRRDRWSALPNGILPGFGEEYDDCGDDYPHFCEDCGHPEMLGRTCYRFSCPRCAPSACRRTAARIGGLRAYLQAVENQPYYQDDL